MSRSNEWGESLERTISRSRDQNGLLVYSLVEGEQMTIGINGRTPEGIDLEQSRTIIARSLGTREGKLEITADTAEMDNWNGRVVCLGSYAFSFATVQFNRAGLLRGFVGAHCGVVVDFSAEHFSGETAPTSFMAEYNSLALEGQLVF